MSDWINIPHFNCTLASKKRTLRLFGLLFFSFLSINLLAQNQRPMGLIIEDEAYDSIPLVHRSDGSKYANLPFTKSLKKYCPKPGNQGETGACVPWATGYAGLTICRAIRDEINDIEAITEKANSAAFIFNQIKESKDCSIGTKFSKAFSFLKKKGDCLAIHFNDNNSTCNKSPDSKLLAEARQFKIKDYARLFDFEDSPQRKIEELRMALSLDNPVIIGMNITSSFHDLDANNFFWQPEEDAILTGGHAMVVIAYDHVRKEVEIMNSFGTAWGDNGFFKMGYKDFARMVRYGFQMVVDDKHLIGEQEKSWLWDRLLFGKQYEKYTFQGTCTFRFFNEDLLFEKAKVSFDYNSGIYETNKKWSVGDAFQLQLKNVTKGSYVYVFSVNANGKTTLHFPKKKNRAAFISGKEQVVTIPSEGQVLELTTIGEDYLCLLFSIEEIENIEDVLAQINKEEAPVEDRISRIFNIRKNDLSSINYDHSNMYFNVLHSDLSVSLVPVILKVSAVE